MKTSKYLFIIDPQNDFIEGGSLAVLGGKEALQRIVDSRILDREDWDGIIVSLDSHNPSHLGFGEPKTELRKYLLRGTERPTQWPPHCIIDTHGWEIYGPLQEKLLGMGDRVEYIEKGRWDTDDAYSIFSEKKVFTPLEAFLDMVCSISRENRIEIYWTGLAEDYCVLESIREMLEWDIWRNGYPFIKHTLLSDMTACIKEHIKDENIDVRPYTSS